MTAAVSDFTVKKSTGKISRSNGNITLELIPNEDIIATIKPHIQKLNVLHFQHKWMTN